MRASMVFSRFLPLALHPGRHEDAALQHRLQQQPAQQVDYRRQHRRAVGGEAVLQKDAVKAGRLHLALLPDQDADAGAAVVVQEGRDGPDVRAAPAAPQQHRRNQGVGRRLGPGQRPQQAQAQAAGFEFVALLRREEDVGQNLQSLVQWLHPFVGPSGRGGPSGRAAARRQFGPIIAHSQRKVKWRMDGKTPETGDLPAGPLSCKLRGNNPRRAGRRRRKRRKPFPWTGWK